MSDWKIRAREKRARQLASIPPEWHLQSKPTNSKNALLYIQSSGLLTEQELKITETTSLEVLLKMISSREVSSFDVVKAYSKRAAIAQQLIGCCTEMFFDEALKLAKAQDEHLEQTGKVVGPLHGLPISFKDGFSVIGQDSTMGWVGKINQPAQTNSSLVDVMISLGAIPYVKTNVPQAMRMSDSYNHVFKQSYNALNNELISGGSSGGEGALVGARGSIVGIGTDVGGSCRIPASLQGIYGLCPTVGRVPFEAQGKRENLVQPVAGPIAASLSAIETYMFALLSSEPWTADPLLYPIPWRTELAQPPSRPLKIGYYFDDGAVKPQPPIERAIREVVTKLKGAGHELIEWDTTSHAEGCQLWMKAILSDGGQACANLCKLSNEPLIEGMIVGSEADKLSVLESEELTDMKHAYQKRYLKRWKDAGIDALITPVQPWVGYKPKTWVKSSQHCGYTAHWNLVDYAALAVPVTVVDEVLDLPGEEWKAHKVRNESDAFNHSQYDVELVKGMPVGVQIVGGRFGEEKAVGVAKAVEAVLRG